MNQRDLELLSSYLDGQLSPSDVTRLEARLISDPELAFVLNDLRATRTLLRKLPPRRAPRNFTLTRKMVGLNPPLPRTYPLFRFASALATLLFLFSFGLNSVGRYASQAPLGFGMGGGGGVDSTAPQEAESFAAEAPMAAATEAPAEPSIASAPQATPAETQVADAARVQDTPASKAGNAANADPQNNAEPEAPPSPVPLVSSIWQVTLAVAAIFSALLMFMMRRMAKSRWR